MDNDNSTSRVERSLWAVWCYITGALNRFFRPEPPHAVGNDPVSSQESTFDSEPAIFGHAEGDTSRGDVDEELPPATVSGLSLSRSVVAWDLCTTEINSEPAEESMQLCRDSDSKLSDEGDDDMSEEWFNQEGNNDAGLLSTEDAKEEEQEEGKSRTLSTSGQDEKQENDEYEEHVHTISLRPAGDAVAEDEEGSRGIASTEEVTETPVTPDDQQKLDETMTELKQKEEEEDNKMNSEDEHDVEAGDIEAHLCTTTCLNQTEDDMHIEEEGVQRDKTDTVVTHEDVEDGDDLSVLVSKIKNKSDEGAEQAGNQPPVSDESDDLGDFKAEPSLTSLHVASQMAENKTNIVSGDELIVGQKHVTAQRSVSDKADDVKEKEDEKEPDAVTEEENENEAAKNQTTDEESEQEEDIKPVTEDQQEEDIATGHVTFSEEDVLNLDAEPYTAKFTDTKVQTKTREMDEGETEGHAGVMDGESDMTTADISIDETLFDKDQGKEERPPSEVCNKDSYIEDLSKIPSVTVRPEGETEQEMSGGFKNIPPGMCEGQLVVLRELHSPACEETQEGVPGYNNEPGSDENTTQRFLEVGDYEEVQTMQLPEEVEGKELESLQNSSHISGADYLLETEHTGEEQASTEDIKKSFDLDVEEHAGVVLLTDAGLPQESINQELGNSFEQEEGKILVDSMKTGIDHSEEESEINVGLADESDQKLKELHDVTEEVLVEFETDKSLCDFKEDDAAAVGCETTGTEAAERDEIFKFLEAEAQMMTEVSFLQELEDALNSEQSSNRTPDLHEDLTQSGYLKQSVETAPKLLGDIIIEVEKAGTVMDESGYGVKEAVEGDVQHNDKMEDMNQQVEKMAADLTTESTEKEHALITEYESLEKQNQLTEEALEISNEEDKEAIESMITESKPKDLIAISAEETKHVMDSEGGCVEETVSPISECQDVIEDEILDLWIETVLSEDTEGIKQQERPESGQEMDTEMEPLNDEQDEISPEKDKEQLEESNTAESELVDDTDMSSSTAESGFLDQGSTGSFQAIYDMLANMSESADIFEQPTQQPDVTSQDMPMEETAETERSNVKEEESVTETGFHPDSDVSQARHQDLDNLQEKTDEETGLQEDIDAEITDIERVTEWKNIEEAGVKSVTEISTFIKDEETTIKDEALDITVSDSLETEETAQTDSGHSRSNSEASLEEGIVSTESRSPCGTCTESLSLDNQSRWSADISDSLPVLIRAEMAQQPMTDFEYQMEVDGSVLDFTAQKSRIAVKNPHVRPPKDPRSLLHMPSLDPTPASHLPVKVPAGVPLGGLGIGIKLPGLGAGFPVLKKTRVVKDENSHEASSLEPETKPEVKTETPKEDETQHKPRWMPPRHPGFGNPLMSELKTKLKKTSKE